ncbi:MAG: nucleoside triphosphate pyrophosphohydrolase [Gammaproteobacteria bacterium]|nr:nucleoside triphosphate pyrophosphohydrolase [Gammaproteobacteria bacterium]
MHTLNDLLTIMTRLRDPQTGCPWDKQQSFNTIAPYTIEEAYEVVDAIERFDMSDLRDELGDLLFQVVYHAQIAQEQDHFNFNEVVHAICEKMLRRHPHVFGAAQERPINEIKQNWEAEKARERANKNSAELSAELATGTLTGIALALPALKRAMKLQKRAAQVGFDWPSVDGVFAKCVEELQEVRATHLDDKVALQEELGDLLFSCVNLARHLEVDPEEALRKGNHKFERRFAAVEEYLHAQNIELRNASVEQMNHAWDMIKQAEKAI